MAPSSPFWLFAFFSYLIVMKYLVIPVITVVLVCHWLFVREHPVAIENAGSSPFYRDLKWGELNFLHTTDTHGWYSGHFNQKQYNANWGDFVSFSIRMKQKAQSQNQDLLLIDTGDRHDGNGLSDITSPNGQKSLPIFTKQDYDLITIGNHELYLWENSKSEFEIVAERYKDSYVSTNVEILINDSFVPFGEKYRYLETPVQKLRVLLFGFLFDFNRNNDKTKVFSIAEVIKQKWFHDILNEYPEEKLDYVVVIGHIPITHEWKELDLLHGLLRKRYPNIVIQYFGGHSHIRDFVVYDENLTSLESGRFCETVGWLSVNKNHHGLEKFSRSYLDFNVDSFKHHLGRDNFLTKEGDEIKDLITKTRAELNLDEYIGRVENNYYMDYVPTNHKNSIFKLLSDRVLPSLEVNGTNDRVIVINTGSVRYDLYKGNYTTDTKYIVSPFKNDWVKINLPKRIALEVPQILNDGRYINLLPTNQRSNVMRKKVQNIGSSQTPFKYPVDTNYLKLSKGYVTHDDFGSNGDDVIHKPVINFPVPNVVHSVELSEGTEYIDLVFYNFLSWNVLEALKVLTGKDYSEDIEFYSLHYLGDLLSDYVKSNSV